jgi:hypothetical protein
MRRSRRHRVVRRSRRWMRRSLLLFLLLESL